MRRATAAQPRKPSTWVPGRSVAVPSGEPASRSLRGSAAPAGPTRVRAESRPSLGCASKCRAAAARAPGAHQESSSLNATYGVSRARTPWVRARAPRLTGRVITRTRGKSRASMAAVSSVEALSTTRTWGRSGRASRRRTVTERLAERLRVAMTTPTGAGAVRSARARSRVVDGPRSVAWFMVRVPLPGRPGRRARPGRRRCRSAAARGRSRCRAGRRPDPGATGRGGGGGRAVPSGWAVRGRRG